jgi:hypothetical protein
MLTTSKASRRGYLFGWLPAIAREQSPSRIIDFLRQRRRWYNGSWRLKGVSSKLMATQWSLGPLGYMLYVTSFTFHIQAPKGIGTDLPFTVHISGCSVDVLVVYRCGRSTRLSSTSRYKLSGMLQR